LIHLLSFEAERVEVSGLERLRRLVSLPQHRQERGRWLQCHRLFQVGVRIQQGGVTGKHSCPEVVLWNVKLGLVPFFLGNLAVYYVDVLLVRLLAYLFNFL